MYKIGVIWQQVIVLIIKAFVNLFLMLNNCFFLNGRVLDTTE